MSGREPIAVVGMGCRFPGAPDPAAYWTLLRRGRSGIVEVPRSRWDIDAYYDARPGMPGKIGSRYGGFIEDVERFDADFFGISAREARQMDPQQRLALEVAWEALEHAGEPADCLAGSATGVFLGVYHEEYGALAGTDPARLDTYSGTGTARALTANRISYCLDLRGPSLTIDTTCSSSLVAVHQACQALWLGDCDRALAGGVSLMLSPLTSVAASQLLGLAPDGRCKTFDASADGIVRGEGCGMVVLERLADARRRGDRVLAVIHGSAVNQDGLSNGLTAPSQDAQAALVRRALAVAGLQPRDISYVETHGTGTALGDPIEVAALASVFGGAGRRVTLGAVKTNIGHLEAAAGIAALVKAVLCVFHGEIPPNLHLATPNPELRLDDTPFELPASVVRWSGKGPRFAGVSSFSIGGTNAHVIVGEPPAGVIRPRSLDGEDRLCVLPISAASETALQALAARYRAALPALEAEGVGLADVCLSAATGRSALARRAAIVAPSFDVLRASLERLSDGAADSRVIVDEARGVRANPVFVFSGQGSQWPGMGRDLLRGPAAARRMLERCDEAFRRLGAGSPIEQMTPDGADVARTVVAQPAIFTVQLALAAQLRAWGVEPAAVIGHSLGEITAACAAGSLEPEDAARIIVARSEAMRRVEGRGAMVAVDLDERAVHRYLAPFDGEISVAAVNAPASIVVSGPSGAVDRLIGSLTGAGVAHRKLAVACAFHSAQVAPLGPSIERACAGIAAATPLVPFVSTVTGDFLGALPLDATYWRRNALEPVRLAAAVERLLSFAPATLVEIAPHGVLTRDLRRCAAAVDPDTRVVSTGRRGRGDLESLMLAVGALFVHGCGIDWRRVYGSASRHIALPTYPWQRVRHWHDEDLPAASATGVIAPEPAEYEIEWTVPADLDAVVSRVRARAEPAVGIFDRLSSAFAPRVRALCADYASRALNSAEGLTSPLAAHLRGLAQHAQAPGGETLEEVLAAFPECADELALLGTCGPALGAALAGRVDPVELLFGGRTGEIVERLYRESPFARAFNPVVADLIEELTSGSKGPIRILEIGAGTGGTTAALLPRLPPDRARYTFTDLSPHFAAAARARFAAYPFVTCARLDIESPPSAQGFESGTWDVIIAANVLHATRDIGASLDRVRDLLAPDGTLVLLEGTSSLDWAALTFGLMDGWWAFADEWRTDGPLLSSSEWTRLLSARRFLPSLVVPSAGRPGLGTVLVARPQSMGATLPSTAPATLVLADEPLASALIETLSRESTGAIASITEDAALPETVRSWRSRIGPSARVLHAFGVESEARHSDAIEDVARRAERSAGTLVGVVQGLQHAHGSTRVWVITSGVAGSTARGIGRTLAAEHPELWGGLLDVEAGTPASQAAAIATALRGGATGEDVSVRHGVRRVARLRRRAQSPGAAARICRDGSYLITGGLGGVGLALAQWLVERGAGRIVLAGRRGADSPGANAAAARLSGRGTEIHVAAADVTDQASVARLIAECASPPFALRGIVHAAGVVEDGVLARLDPLRIGHVLAPKVRGGWNLHLATREHPLDWFLLCSSATTMLGLPGLGGYAAANAFLDALALYRRDHGLPAVSIAWSGWARTGMAAAVGDGREAQWRARGLEPMRVADALAASARMMAPAAPAHVLVGAVDWPRYTSGFPSGTEPRLFDQMQPAPAAPLFRDEEVADDDRPRALADVITREIRRSLMIDPASPVPPDRPLTELGVDSLMAVELRNTLSRLTGASLPSTIVYDYPTIDALAGYLLAAGAAQPAGVR